MILDTRQTKFGAVNIPEIAIFPTEIRFTPKWLSIKNALVDALSKQYRSEDLTIMNDCVAQTLNFLIILGATNEPEKEIKKITLWKDWIQLTPIYEGINIQLKTMLIKQHYPFMYSEISKGQVYSHWGLTIIKECVLYTLEYLEKNQLLKMNLN